MHFVWGCASTILLNLMKNLGLSTWTWIDFYPTVGDLLKLYFTFGKIFDNIGTHSFTIYLFPLWGHYLLV